MKSIPVLFFQLFVLFNTIFAADYKISVSISNLTDTRIYLASLRGDAYKIMDTAEIKDNMYCFTLPDNQPSGMYRIIPEAVLNPGRRNAPMNTLDFIFNRENVVLKTVYPWLTDSLVVIESAENKIYFDFLNHEKQIQNKLNLLDNMLVQYPSDDVLYSDIIKRYNALQLENQKLIRQTCDANRGTYAAAVITMFKTPLPDGRLSETERHDFLKQHYFDGLEYDNTALIYSGVYTHHMVQYLMLCRDPMLAQPDLENEFNKAVDVILAHSVKNPEVYDFVLNYLMEGFERLKLENVLKYISEKYANTVCTSGNSSTLLRRMESYSKMSVGMQAPDLILKTLNNQEINLASVIKPYKLIVFWASWCPNCEELMPKLKKWYDSKAIELEIAAVSLDTVYSDWKQSVEKNDYRFINSCDLKGWNGKAAEDYCVYATPTLFLLDNNSKIIAKPMSFDEFLKSVEGLH
jgi:thiol-disulfide isomerase/thioredoxin